MEDNVKNLGKVCITPEGVWDVNKEYDRLALVVTTDDDTQRVLSYVSRQHVPAGQITLSNKDYWQLFATGLTMQDITVDENGNIKMGDTVIYQIPLGDALGEIVVDKIKTDLTNYIMTEIRSYMNGMVTELISSFSTQIGRLIDNGFEVRNKLSGEVNAKHSGTIDVNVNGGSEDDDEYIFTTETVNMDITSNSQNQQIYVNSEQNGTPVKFSALSFPNWVGYLTIPSNPTTVSSLVIINFKENTSEDSRSSSIILQQEGSNKTIKINVIQRGTSSTPTDEFVFESNRSDVTNTAIAGNNAISLTSTKNGELVGFTTTSKPEWITISSYENQTRHEVTLAFAANDSENDRTGTVIFTQNESGNTVTINVTQYGTEHIVTPTHMVDVTVINGVTQEQIPTARIFINNVEARNRTFDEGTDVSVRVNAEGYIARDIVERPITQQDPLVQSDYEYSETINDISQDAYITVELYPEPDQYTFVAGDTNLNYAANIQAFGTTLTSTKNGSQIGYTVSSQPNWVTAINTQQNGAISGNMTANDSANSRTGEIVLTQNESNNVVTITIVQAGTGSGEDSGGDSGGGDSGGGDSGGDSDSDVYVFEATPNTLSFEAGLNLTKTVNVVSTKNGNNIEFTRNGISDWLTASISNGVVTITAEPNPSNESRTGFVKFLQVDGSSTVLTVNITQAGYEALPSGYEFAHMLDNNGENMTEVSFNSTDPISFDSSTNFRTLTTILKENGTISNDVPTIVYNGYPAGAADTTTFTVNKSQNSLVFQVPTKPSTGVSTAYEFVVLYGNYGAKRNITLAYIPS